jgi:hypothetical protein
MRGLPLIPREAYRVLLQRRGELDRAFEVEKKEIREGYEREVYRAALPFRKGSTTLTHERAVKLIGEEKYKEIRTHWQTLADASIDTLIADRKKNKEKLEEVAEEAEVMKGENRFQYSEYWSSSYDSTGSGSHYAEVKADWDTHVLTQAGYEVEQKVKEFSGGGVSSWKYARDTFTVYVSLQEEIDLHILKKKLKVTLREWLQFVLQHGCNPRVYSPFLPHGIEAKLGLDHFGRDIAKEKEP